MMRGNVMLSQRQGLIVWLNSIKQAKMLRKFGNVHYVSKRLKYVVLYCNQKEIEELTAKLTSFSFVKKVEPSYKPFLKIEFENSKPDKAKEYDYKMGI
ncbi:MAG TPA: YlbG family protein [Hanamia sp.]|nr:YlbG family protein [Hanamia sp.]